MQVQGANHLLTVCILIILTIDETGTTIGDLTMTVSSNILGRVESGHALIERTKDFHNQINLTDKCAF